MEETLGYDSLFSPEEWDAIERGEWGGLDPDGEPSGLPHVARVFAPPGQYAGNEGRFEVECDSCGDVGAEDTEEDADALALLHEVLGAVVVASQEVE